MGIHQQAMYIPVYVVTVSGAKTVSLNLITVCVKAKQRRKRQWWARDTEWYAYCRALASCDQRAHS